MWDDIPLEEAVAQVRQILTQTLAGKMVWSQAPTPGAYVAERSRVAATLDRVQGTNRRQKFVRLRFSPRGDTDFKTGMQQHVHDGEPLVAEIELDSYLARLYQVVEERLGEAPTLVEDFVEDVE